MTTEPLFYADGEYVFKRPVESPRGCTMGFRVCKAADGIESDAVAACLNERENLLATSKALLAADDAMVAFLIGADPEKMGETEWRREHDTRSNARKFALQAARDAVAKAEGK